MATVEYMHICDYALVDQVGKQSILGIFDSIGGSTFPVKHPQLYVAVKLLAKPHLSVPLAFRIALKSKSLFQSPELQAQTNSEGCAYIIMNVQGAEFPEPGKYSVSVLSSGSVLATQQLSVSALSNPAAAKPN